MAQNVVINGVTYSSCPEVDIPKSGGGTAKFFDIADTTAVAADVASGKYFYAASGVKTAGTGTGTSISPSSATPQPLGTATAGISTDYSRGDHVHSSEIFIGSTTPSGYKLYIDPDGSLPSGEGVSF